MKALSLVLNIFTITILGVICQKPSDDVYQSLSSMCSEKFLNESCPFRVAYDIATQLILQWEEKDGGRGLWSNGNSSIWWQSGVGLWSLAEFLHVMNGTATDKLYLATRWAATETAKYQNNFLHTKFTDDQAWWANGALRLLEYVRLFDDDAPELLNAAQIVINDNLVHETSDCGGGIFWYYGAAPPSNTSKTTISNVLTMNLMTTMYTFTNDSTLLNGGPKGGSIDIYNWLLRTTLLDRQTGFEQDNIDTFNDTCSINGGPLTYEYGVLIQALLRLAAVTNDSSYLNDSRAFIEQAVKLFTKNNILFEGCDFSNSCQGDQLAFRGVLYLGLARFYKYTHDSRIGQIIEDSYSAMLTRKIDDRYPLSLINGNNNFTGRDEIIITIGDLNLVSAMILVYKFKYNAYLSSADIDRTINGLLPFDGTNQALTVCLCTDIGCPSTHETRSFYDSGYKNGSDVQPWNNDISAFLIGPNHRIKLFKNETTIHSDWLTKSVWDIDDQFRKQIDSIAIDYEL